MDTNPSDNMLSNIVLAGPTTVGKDWLISAFAKELSILNQSHRNNSLLRLWLQNEDGSRQLVEPNPPLNIPATVTSRDYSYIFSRSFNSEAQRRFDAEHQIELHNDSGRVIVDALKDPNTFFATYQTLMNSRNIILLMGPPKQSGRPTQSENYFGSSQDRPFPGDIVPTFPGNADIFTQQPQFDATSGFSSEAISGDWTIGNYEKFLKTLFAQIANYRLEGEANNKRNIAICLTKVDEDRYGGKAEHAFLMRYGQGLARYLEIQKQHHNIAVFKTSAAGMLRLENTQVSNIQNGALRDPGRWQPYGTVDPFFWIFEMNERTVISNRRTFWTLGDPLRDYPKYPRSRDLR